MGSPGRREIGMASSPGEPFAQFCRLRRSFPIRCASSPRSPNPTFVLDATVCGSSLALEDAGVPLKRRRRASPWAYPRRRALRRVVGHSRRRDHLGDMDFKVAARKRRDLAADGHQDRRITEQIMKVALAQARDGRLHILDEMAKAIATSRAELGEFAPRIETLKSPPTRSAK